MLKCFRDIWIFITVPNWTEKLQHLNPIDELWAKVKRKIRATKATSGDNLKAYKNLSEINLCQNLTFTLWIQLLR